MKIINFVEFKILILISFVLFACASSQKNSDSVFSSRPFLREYKRYSLTSGESNPALDAVIDREGTWIYYARENAGNTDIFAVDSYTLEDYRLTRSPGIDTSVSIDDKSRYLVFSSTRDDAFGDIYLYKLVNIFGVRTAKKDLENLEQNIVRLTDYKGYDEDPVVSHKGNMIAFVSDRDAGTKKLFTMRANGKELKKLSDIEASSPTFSFDDSKIAFITSKIGEKHSQLVVLDLNADTNAETNLTILTDTKTFKFNPTFYNDDTIIFFEIERDSDRDGNLTYYDKRRLMSYSLSTHQYYVLDEDTKLSTFNVAYPSALVGAYVVSEGSTSIVTMGSTKEYFIKDANANTMYSTFTELPYERKLDVIDRFSEYFPFYDDQSSVAKAYFNIMISSYTNTNTTEYNRAVKVLTDEYQETFAGFLASRINQNFNTNDNWLDIKYYTNDYFLTNNGSDEIINFVSWAGYISANEKYKANNRNASTLTMLSNIITLNTQKDLYMLIAKLYSRSAEGNGYKYPLNENIYNNPYRRKDLIFSERLEIAKDFIKDTKIPYDSILTNAHPYAPLSVAARLKYLDSLILSRNYNDATNLFKPYIESRNDIMLALGYYANAKVLLAQKDDGSYALFKNALTSGGNNFNSTSEANECKIILANYYKSLADSAYNEGRYAVAYDNYQEVLKYNPNDASSSSKLIESGLRAYSTIDSLEKTIVEREKNIISTRYSDHEAHAELANAYYYLANRYYSMAIGKQYSPDRYVLSEKKREDGFYLYLNKSFNAIVDKAKSYIDFAIFLYPDNEDYYIKKAEMLTFAQALKMQVLQDQKTYKSVIELVPAYKDDAVTNDKYMGYNMLAFQTANLDSEIIDSLIMAKSKVRTKPNVVSLMLANSYLINGRYSDAANEYKEAEKLIRQAGSDKSMAWYHFFHGYSLWMNNDVNGAYREYESARKLFEKLGDKESVYKIVGYTSIAAIEQEDYKKAIESLLERDKLTQNDVDKNELNQLLLAACYLKLENYNNALMYCDNVKAKIDSLDSSLYTPNYLSITFYGANINIINLGLASLGGYIPGEPLNVDKQQMLYSIYQELYEKMGRYSEAREALSSYRNYIIKDKPKKSIQPLMLATYYNNEGYLYYQQGEQSNSIMSFKASIEEYKKTLDEKTLANNPSLQYQNAENDAKNYLSLSSLYLRYLSENDLTSIRREFFIELFNTTKTLQILSTNNSVSTKDRLLLYSHIAAFKYIMAFKLTADNSIEYNRKKNDDPTDMTDYDINIQRLSMLKDAIDRYKYILSSNSNFPVDLKTEIIIRYNLAKAYELAGYIEEAAREYMSAFSKAQVSAFAVEEIAILTTLIDFSTKYRDRYPDSLDYPVQYVFRILQRLRESVFMITFVEGNNFILRQAKYKVIEFLQDKYPDASLNILAMFDAIDMRRKFLDRRLYTLGENNYYLREYYKLYEKALYSYQRYLNAVATPYDSKTESAMLKEILSYEKEAISQFSGTPIESIVICDVKPEDIDRSMRKDETLIWDTYLGYRFVRENGKTSFYIQSNAMPKTKNYVTHIGFRPISISNRNIFVRELYDSTEYMLPPKTAYIDTKLISFFRTARNTEKEINTMSMSSNTNSTNNTYSYNTNNLAVNVAYNSDTNTVSSNDSASTNRRRRRGNFKFIELKDIVTNSYVPLVVDITGASASDISNVMSKNLYIVYSDKETFDKNRRVLRNINNIALVVGNSGKDSRMMFYTNYFRRLSTNSLEETMKGYDNNLFTIYGKPDYSMSSLSNAAYEFKTRLYTSYDNNANPSITMMSNVIAYSQSDDEKMFNYAKIVEDRYNAKDTNTAYIFSEEGYKFFASSYSNISDSNAYKFIKSMLPVYRRMGEEGAVKGANRALHFIYLYTNNNYDLIDEYFTPRTLSRFLKARDNAKENVRYLNYIANKVDGDNKDKILEVAVLYDLIYAKTPIDTVTNFLSRMKNTNEILTVANTILDNKVTNENDIFRTMNYIYGNQYIFETETVSSFADRFYSLYKTNSAYIYGLLNKIRVPESDFDNNIENAYEIFSNENTNTMFIFYAYENNKYVAYSYVVGDSEVKKANLIDMKKLGSYLESFTNASKARDRRNALKSIEGGMLSSDIIKDSQRVERIYITGSYANLFTVPFAYLNAFKNNDVIKIREFKYSPSYILNIGKPTVKLNIGTNFYTSLETAAVQSFNEPKGNIGLTHYIGIDTNRNKPFNDIDLFLSPARNADIFGYLRARSETKLMFTYTTNNSGDYYTVMKYLYNNFGDGIIDAYRFIKTNRVPINTINTSDRNMLYMANYALFDYILPGIPRDK
ncbi:PD40 domain-containing protein [Brachyspira alvinipulli]|uniref:PD40 domain-containing protein n=1 Tax=Brachyspira alvinipulli TaxID=84379 RepID=UPI00047FF2DE|nr:PD40 domain-containing protein [Brachyspira alvinipulli]